MSEVQQSRRERLTTFDQIKAWNHNEYFANCSREAETFLLMTVCCDFDTWDDKMKLMNTNSEKQGQLSSSWLWMWCSLHGGQGMMMMTSYKMKYQKMSSTWRHYLASFEKTEQLYYQPLHISKNQANETMDVYICTCGLEKINIGKCANPS